MQNILKLTQDWAKTLGPLCQGPEQKKALQAFMHLGLPDQHLESWAFTKTLGALSTMKPGYAKAMPVARASTLQGRFGITLQDGRVTECILPPDISFHSLQKTSDEKDNSSLFINGLDTLHDLSPEAQTVLITAKTKEDIKETLFVYILESENSAGTITPTRLKFGLAPHCQIDLIFILTNVSRPGLSLSHVELCLEENAQANVAIVAKASTDHLTFHRWQAFLKRDSHLHSVVLTAGAQPSRHEFEAHLLETGASATLQGLYLLGQKQHADINTIIHHKAPHTTSSQLFKAVVKDEAYGIYTGKVVIHPGCPGSNAGQKALGTLLGQHAHFTTRPQLEVYNDDVKCGHGAAIGQLNEDESFYLTSRGISPERTRQILLQAFVAEIVENFPVPLATIELKQAVQNYFQTMPGGPA